MIYSMTGYGRGVASSTSKRITLEIKTLNSKQLDLTLRAPSIFRELEVSVRPLIAEKLFRGKIDIVCNVENLEVENVTKFNKEALQEYKRQIEEISQFLAIEAPSDWYSILLRLPEVIKPENNILTEEEKEAFLSALKEAIKNTINYRAQEGEKLNLFFIEKIEKIKVLLSEVPQFEQERIKKVRNKLEELLTKLPNAEYDENRLEQELVFYIEKLDITEEKVRLKSHLNYFIETLETKESNSGLGKKLGFILQEIGREINTMGSKANHLEIQKIVVKMKDELEQMKEQVLNVL